MSNDVLRLMVGWSDQFGVDIIGMYDEGEDMLMDVFAVIDKILYDDFSKEPVVETIRSMAFTFDKNGNRIRHNIHKNNLKLLRFLDDYYKVAANKIEEAYRLRISANTVDEYVELINSMEKNYSKNADMIEEVL